jgi:hypothetical protein
MKLSDIKEQIDQIIIHKTRINNINHRAKDFVIESLNESYKKIVGDYNELIVSKALIGSGTINGCLELSLDDELIRDQKICIEFENKIKKKFNAFVYY